MPIIYKPNTVDMSPNYVAIDPSVDNDFTVIIDGKQCIAYRKFIYDLENNLEIDTNRVDLATTLYDAETLSVTLSASSLTAGEEYKWKIWMFANDKTVSSIDISTDILTATAHGMATGDTCVLQASTTQPSGTDDDTIYYVRRLSSSTFALYENAESAKSDGTKVDITSTGSGVTVSQVAESKGVQFFSYTDPSLSLTISSPHTSQELTATPTYSQSEDVQIKFFNATLYDSSQNVIKESGNIYSSNIGYTFDGLIDGESYYVEFNVETDLDQIATTGLISFSVDYSQPTAIASPIVTNMPEKSAILVDWTSAIRNPTATSVGTITYDSDFIYTENKALILDAGESVAWDDDVFIPEGYTAHYIWNPQATGNHGAIFKLENDFDSTYVEIGNDGERFYTYDGTNTIKYGNDINNHDFNNGVVGWSEFVSSSSVVGNILTFDIRSNYADSFFRQLNISPSSKYFLYVKLKANSTSQITSIGIRTTGGTNYITDNITNYIELYGTMTTTSSSYQYFDIMANHSNVPSATDSVSVDGTAGVYAINMTQMNIENYTDTQMLNLIEDGYFDPILTSEYYILTLVDDKLTYKRNTL